MESIVNGAVHIEFYGMPGCGKSVVAAKLAKNLRDKGFTVREPSREVGNEINKGKRFVKKSYFTVKYCFLHPKTAMFIARLIKKCGYSGKTFFVQFINLIPKKYIYSTAQNGVVYIWDEGVIQSAVSLSVNGKMHAKDALSELICTDDMLYRLITIYLKTDINTVVSRLEKRSYGNSRVEKEKDSKQKIKLLQAFECNCEQLQTGDAIDCSSKSIDEIAKQIEYINFEMR